MVEQTHMNELTRIRTYMLCKRSNGSVWSSITDANKSTITNDDHTGSEVSETSTGKKDMSWPPLTVCLHSLLCALFLHSIQWQWQEKKKLLLWKVRHLNRRTTVAFQQGFEHVLEGHKHVMLLGTLQKHWWFLSTIWLWPIGTNKVHKCRQQKTVTVHHANKTTMFLIKNYIITKWS